MIHSDIPLSRLITSKSLAASGRLPDSARWTLSLRFVLFLLRAWTPEPGKHIHPLPRHLLLPGEEKGHEGHGEKRLPCALGAVEGPWSPLGQTRPRGRGGAEGKWSWLGLFFLVVTSLPPSLYSSPELPTSRLSSFSPDNHSIVIIITSTQFFQQRTGYSRRGGRLPWAFIALSRATDCNTHLLPTRPGAPGTGLLSQRVQARAASCRREVKEPGVT